MINRTAINKFLKMLLTMYQKNIILSLIGEDNKKAVSPGLNIIPGCLKEVNKEAKTPKSMTAIKTALKTSNFIVLISLNVFPLFVITGIKMNTNQIN
jgi:hypothetical protein